MKSWILVVLAGCVLAATASPIIMPRPVDNTRDPHDGEPFEWEPVDDDPWPGPSITFPQLPALEAGGRPSRGETQAQAAFLMQFLRALFNNNNRNYSSNNNNVPRGRGGEKPISSNEVGSTSYWSQQKKP